MFNKYPLSFIRKKKKMYQKLANKKKGLICYICKKSLRIEWREYEYWLSNNGSQEDRQKIDLSIDHVRPRSKGGSEEISNLRLVHKTCNCSKADNY